MQFYPPDFGYELCIENILGYNSEIHRSVVVSLDFKTMKQNVCGPVWKVSSGFWAKLDLSLREEDQQPTRSDWEI